MLNEVAGGLANVIWISTSDGSLYGAGILFGNAMSVPMSPNEPQ